MSRATFRRTAAVAVAALLVVSACSSDEAAKPYVDIQPATTTPGPADTTADERCSRGATVGDVEAIPVDGVDSDHDLTSFDGETIRFHWFPTDTGTVMDFNGAESAPTVLMGPGWSLAGDTSQEGSSLFGALSIGALNEHGYNVLTWDPRGFGESTGTVGVNDPEAEGLDVQLLIDWLAETPGVLLDSLGDPRMGMLGSSYGGGIQLTMAAIDCRVDAIVPNMAWNSLETSLYKGETVKQGWAELLLTTAAGRDLDPHIQHAADDGLSKGTLTEDDKDWFRSRGPHDLIDRITVPTMIVQGTVDNLFTLQEGITNYRVLRDNDVPTAMAWYCGGHGTCLTSLGNKEMVAEASFAWLDRYVKDDESVDTGPRLRFVDQEGTTWTADDYPVGGDTDSTNLEANGSGTLTLTAAGGSGPNTVPAVEGDPLAGLVKDITPAVATNAVDVPLTVGDVDGIALGSPHLEITYTGTDTGCSRPPRAFAQLVDVERGVVVGNQVTPFPVVLDGESHTITVDLEVIAQRVRPGDRLTLQLVAATTAYAVGCTSGSVTFDDAHITVPVVLGLAEG
ncbi:MAG: alpha/beta fold hydrolase [Aquihabitans sp.]